MLKINNILFVGVSLLFGLFITSCTGKAEVYGDLEQYWKEEKIVYNETDSTVECYRLYWAFQLGLTELRDLGDNGFGTFVCLFDYDESGGTLRLYEFRTGHNTETVPADSLLQNYGVPTSDVTFEVVKLNHDDMVLRCDTTTLYFCAF